MARQLSVLWVTYQSAEAKTVLDGWLAAPWEYSDEARAILMTLRSAVVAGIGNTPDKEAGLRHRSQALVSNIVDATSAMLARHLPAFEHDENARKIVQACASLVDCAGSEIFFATEAAAGQRDNNPALGYAGLGVFFRENADLLKRISTYATPHTTYHLLQLVERLVDVDTKAAFDLAASSVSAARQWGYQYESLGADLMVKLIGVFLADHREIFGSQDRRAALVDCLGIFQEVGWLSALRLLYRLPELIQ